MFSSDHFRAYLLSSLGSTAISTLLPLVAVAVSVPSAIRARWLLLKLHLRRISQASIQGYPAQQRRYCNFPSRSLPDEETGSSVRKCERLTCPRESNKVHVTGRTIPPSRSKNRSSVQLPQQLQLHLCTFALLYNCCYAWTFKCLEEQLRTSSRQFRPAQLKASPATLSVLWWQSRSDHGAAQLEGMRCAGRTPPWMRMWLTRYLKGRVTSTCN